MRSPQARGAFIRAEPGSAKKQISPPLGTTWHGHNHCLENVPQSPPTTGPGNSLPPGGGEAAICAASFGAEGARLGFTIGA